MLSLVSVLLLAQLLPSEQLIRPRVYRSDGADRVMRLGADDYAFFEFAPASGAGMPAACSSTAPTGAKGEALTFARASVATCTKTATGGLVTSGIAAGDLVEMSNNVARVEYDSGGVLGLRVEGSGQNVLTRFIDYANAAWSDVGTPTLTGSQASPFSGTYATSAVRFDDNDGAAFEGRSIPITVSAGSAYFGHCYVKGGTATSARIVLDGTAATITGLSTTSWSIVEVADASASAASITLEVDVGSTAAATGTVVWGGCDVKLGAYRTSIVPTVAAAVTRAVEDAYFATTGAPGLNTGSMAASVTYNYSANTYTTPVMVTSSTAPASSGANAFTMYSAGTSGTSFKCYVGDNGAPTVYATGAANLVAPFTGTHRGWCSASGNGSTVTGMFDTNNMSASGAIAGSYAAEAYLFVGGSKNTLTYADGVVSRVCRDPSPTRCR